MPIEDGESGRRSKLMTAQEMAARRWAKVPKGAARTALAKHAANKRWENHVKKPRNKITPAS
jgi:hypothetical protein